MIAKYISETGAFDPTTMSLLTKAQLTTLLKVTPSELDCMIASPNPRFPKPIRLGRRIVRWIDVDITTYLENCIETQED